MAKVPQTQKEASIGDDQDLLTWQAPQYFVYNRSTRWYFIVGSAALGLIALVFVIEHFGELNVSPWLAGGVILAAAATLLTREIQKPTLADYALTESGILIDSRAISYKDYRAYSIISVSEHQVLKLWPAKKIALPQMIILEGVEIPDVKEIVSQFLPEELDGETWLEYFSRLIKL